MIGHFDFYSRALSSMKRRKTKCGPTWNVVPKSGPETLKSSWRTVGSRTTFSFSFYWICQGCHFSSFVAWSTSPMLTATQVKKESKNSFWFGNNQCLLKGEKKSCVLIKKRCKNLVDGMLFIKGQNYSIPSILVKIFREGYDTHNLGSLVVESAPDCEMTK